MDTYVLPTLFCCVTTSVNFDLWMSRSGFGTFALVVNFIDDGWVPKHVTISIFEAPNITSATLEKFVKPLFAKFKFTHKIITHVKDEGSNLNTLVATLFTIVFCEPLQLETPFIGVCFGHAMCKACLYATNVLGQS